MMKARGALPFLLLFSAQARAGDAFDAIKCGSDTPSVLVGKTMPGGTAVAIEGRHTAIGLKDLGADEISDHLQMVSWRISTQRSHNTSSDRS